MLCKEENLQQVTGVMVVKLLQWHIVYELGSHEIIFGYLRLIILSMYKSISKTKVIYEGHWNFFYCFRILLLVHCNVPFFQILFVLLNTYIFCFS